MAHRPSQEHSLFDDTTITSVAPGTGVARPRTQPYLVVIAISDDPRAPSSRHLLGAIDEVWFGRGARAAQRREVDGKRVLELSVPDPRMSSKHGRLMRGPLSWVLDDPTSKNGSVVNGEITRQTVVGDGALLELGHTFLLFCDRPVEENAAADLVDGELGVESPAL
ncbi:MAG TPA: FHA domain-containing protein, partial [Kofleriaceae bacterium]|nr:FHA domain-containing protein [Kofleriaceae bacterium]